MVIYLITGRGTRACYIFTVLPLLFLADVEATAIRCGVGSECALKDGIRGCHCLKGWRGDAYKGCESE